jgi:DNA-binding transcriptional MerR regulator
MADVELPDRTLFRAAEVCQIAGIQPYVLRTWEAEFPDLGVVAREGGPRVYRRADVERVLAIKRLVFQEGLTLAGARRRLGEAPRSEPSDAPSLAELVACDVRERLQRVRDGLREVLEWLARPVGGGAVPAVAGVAGGEAVRLGGVLAGAQVVDAGARGPVDAPLGASTRAARAARRRARGRREGARGRSSKRAGRRARR